VSGIFEVSSVWEERIERKKADEAGNQVVNRDTAPARRKTHVDGRRSHIFPNSTLSDLRSVHEVMV
jgi:hypothetical protein